MKPNELCVWHRDSGGKWLPGCRDDVRLPKHPHEFGERGYCQFCGRPVGIDRRVVHRQKHPSRYKAICPCCGMRFADRSSGFCCECEARGWAGEAAAERARRCITARRRRACSSAS